MMRAVTDFYFVFLNYIRIKQMSFPTFKYSTNTLKSYIVNIKLVNECLTIININ